MDIKVVKETLEHKVLEPFVDKVNIAEIKKDLLKLKPPVQWDDLPDLDKKDLIVSRAESLYLATLPKDEETMAGSIVPTKENPYPDHLLGE